MVVIVFPRGFAITIGGNTQGINGSREAEKAGVSNEGLGDHCRLKYEGT
jgi:hypothetical protein